MANEADDFFVGEHFPEAVGGEDEEVAAAGVDFGGGYDGFGGDVGGCFEEGGGTAAEEAGAEFASDVAGPFVDGVAKGTAGLEAAEDAAVADDAVFAGVFFAHAGCFAGIAAGLVFREGGCGPFARLGAAAEDGA